MGSAAPTTHAKILNDASLLMMHLHCIAEQKFLGLETLCAWRDFVSARIDACFFDAPNEVMRFAKSRRRLKLRRSRYRSGRDFGRSPASRGDGSARIADAGRGKDPTSRSPRNDGKTLRPQDRRPRRRAALQLRMRLRRILRIRMIDQRDARSYGNQSFTSCLDEMPSAMATRTCVSMSAVVGPANKSRLRPIGAVSSG